MGLYGNPGSTLLVTKPLTSNSVRVEQPENISFSVSALLVSKPLTSNFLRLEQSLNIDHNLTALLVLKPLTSNSSKLFLSISLRIGALRCESAACTFTSALASDVRRVSYPSHCNPFHADSLSIRNGSHPSRSFAGLTRGAVSAYCGSRGQSSLSTSSHSKRPLPLLRHWNRPRRRP